MGALSWLGRIGILAIGLGVLASGLLGLGLAYRPNHPQVEQARSLAQDGLEGLVQVESLGLSAGVPERFLGAIAGPLRYGLAPIGLVLLALALRRGRRDAADPVPDEDEGFAEVHDKRELKKVRKQASSIARKGMPLEAAELCLAVGLMDEAAGYFVDAEEFVRAAEIRHDQNRFLESAELYLKAESFDAAGVIYSQQGEFARAAEAYVQAGNPSVAAEMYEKAGRHRRAAECYEEAGFPRHAAQGFVRCDEWERAARCLDEVLVDEMPGAGGGDPRKEQEVQKLCRMTGNLYERAGLTEEAEKVLVKGSLFAAAAEIAEKAGRTERAAELFLQARDGPRAARVLQALGEGERAARVLAEYHRDRGDDLEAARCFEQAGELLEAGDLFRMLERYDEAGACYERFGDGEQAAEMFRLGGDRSRAAENYERAGRFADAAECYALLGDAVREAEMLEQGGEFLKAAELHRDSGDQERAIAALQKVEPDSPDCVAAAALLGELFREREMYSLAIAKLRDAVGESDVTRENVRAVYCLATVYEANGDIAEACGLYEKVLAFDYQYQDTEQCLARMRELLAAQEQAAAAAAEASSPSAAGRSGRYVITGTLGRGGMGIVYKANDTVLDREVAFKVLPESLKENPQALKNFLREAKSAAKLNHPNIVTVYDAGEQDGVFYIAMEYVDGNTLKDVVKRRGPISPRGIVLVLAQMAEALAFAHEKKIIHRDIKTANTMWTRDRKAKIMDFGLAKAVEEVRNHTTVVSGTPYYMSPEQTLGKNVDHRTDIYSLGVSVFEMATGTLPFTEGNLPYHHVHTPPPHPKDLNPEVPDFIAQVIERCLCKDPADRYQSTRDILSELRRASSV